MTEAQKLELRTLARLAWNNWPDNETSRAALWEQEVKALAANEAWDRVVQAIAEVVAEIVIEECSRR